MAISITMFFIASIAGRLSAESQFYAPKVPEKSYSLIIDGTATLVGKWTCGGDAKVETRNDWAAGPVAGGNTEMLMVVVTASVPAIECGDSKMNEHLKKALKMEDFPEIRYQGKNYTLVDDGDAVQSSGELTIAGVTKPVGLGAKLIRLPGGSMRVVGQVEVNMLDYEVKPPRLFFGVLKVADTVLVSFDTVVSLTDDVTRSLFSNHPRSN